jgi:hypothetical protein
MSAIPKSNSVGGAERDECPQWGAGISEITVNEIAITT